MAVPALATGTGTAALSALAGSTVRPAPANAATGLDAKARATAVDFEATFLSAMFNQMFTSMDGEGPLGGNPGVGVWRSFLSDEYAKSFAKAGGIGLADHVYRTLIAQQEARG